MSAFTRGVEECEQGNIAQGLLRFARGLEVAPGDEEALIHALRAKIGAWYPWHAAVRRHLPHPSSVGSFVWSGDGSRLMTEAGDNVVRVWDAQGDQSAPIAIPHAGKIPGMALSLDGRRAA